MLRARDVMTREPIWLDCESQLDTAISFMAEYGIRHLPILGRNNDLAGIVSEGDILAASIPTGGRLMLPSVSVDAIMTKDVLTCTPSSACIDAVATMIACKVNSIIVVQEKKLLGIITTTDVMDTFCQREEIDAMA